MRKSIAVDGPAGAGKSSVAKTVAKKIAYTYVDTGAIYRTVGLFAVRGGLGLTDEAELMQELAHSHIEVMYIDGEQYMFLDREDITREIRSPEVSRATSAISAMPGVREYLFEMQRDIAKNHNVIMDGRDIGTVILPNADVKIFLTASPEARARRRYDEYVAKGESVSYSDILEDMKQRDHNDSTRKVAPLKKAEDAILVDCSNCTLEESVQRVLNLLGKRGIS